MPTVAELERLAALIERLTPLTEVERGEPVRAQDWNVVVGTLVEVARAVLAEEREGIPPPHDHTEQVSAGWLDPRLRILVEQGPLADPAAVGRVAALERRVGRLSDRVEEVDAGVKENRSRVVDFATRDLVRESAVTSLHRKVEGMTGAKDDVLALRGTLRSIEENVRVAVDVGSRLSVGGEPVDMEAVEQRLKGLEALEERLRLPTGELLDAPTLEMRLTELTNTLVTEEKLDEVLKIRTGEGVEPGQLDALEEKLRADLMTTVETSMTRLGEEITSETDKRLAGVDGLVSQTVADSLPGLAESVLGSARTEISAAVQAGAQESQALLEKRLGETEEVLRGDVAQQIEDVQKSIAPAVQAEFDLQLPTRLATVQADVTALLERTTQVEATLLGHRAALDELEAKVETRSGSASTARTELQQTLMAEIDSRESAIMGEMESRLTQAETAIGKQIDTAVTDVQRAITAEVERIAGEAASTEARTVANQLRGEMHAVAQDEIAAFQPQLRDMVSQEISRTTADVSALVKAEFEAFKPSIDEMVSRTFQDQGAALVEAELEKIAESRPELQPQADFTRIDGIGATFDLRLRAANVRTFADLAAMSVEAIAETLDTTVSRVESYDIIGQAKRLAGIE